MNERVGSLYRLEIIKYLQYTDNQGAVLDIGCHDNLILSHIDAPLKIAVDIVRPSVPCNILFVQADINHLPFMDGAFNQVFILDVVEHVKEDYLIPNSLLRVLSPKAGFLLTTPSKSIRLYPGFLTNYISQKWGHVYRLGYSKSELLKLFNQDFYLKFMEWNAPWWRFFYLPIRLLSEISPYLMKLLIKIIFFLDTLSVHGDKGYFVLEGTPKNEKK